MPPTRLPSFFVVGAPKAGTTTLYSYLQQHPGVFLPDIKEPHYFAFPEVANTYYNVDIIRTFEEYQSLFAEAEPSSVIGDMSPSYLFQTQAAQRIRDSCPDAKIIIVLRNPVDRAISHYLMDVRDGYQQMPLSVVLDNPEKHTQYYKEYVQVGMYAEQVKAYQQIYSRGEIKIIIFEQMISNMFGHLDSIVEFIGAKGPCEWEDIGVENKYQVYRTEVLKKLQSSKIGNAVSAAVPNGLKEYAKRVVLTDKKPEFLDERNRLSGLYATDIERLATMVRRDLSLWLS